MVEDLICFVSIEFDAILEVNVIPIEKLEEDIFKILKGNFFKILTSQHGSRVMQKSLKNTSKEVLSKILNEVYN